MADTKRFRWSVWEKWPIEKIIGDCYVKWFERFGPEEPNVYILPVGIPAPEIFVPMHLMRDHQLFPHEIDIDQELVAETQSAQQSTLPSALPDTTT